MITLLLPLPPSANALFRNATEAEKARARANGKKIRGRRKTPEYQAWIDTAGMEILAQRPSWKSVRTIKGPYALRVTIGKDVRMDLGNVIKATEDILVRMGLIDDDKFADSIFMLRAHDLNEARLMRVDIQEAGGVTVNPLA